MQQGMVDLLMSKAASVQTVCTARLHSMYLA